MSRAVAACRNFFPNISMPTLRKNLYLIDYSSKWQSAYEYSPIVLINFKPVNRMHYLKSSVNSVLPS
jgi:hypothetical protein